MYDHRRLWLYDASEDRALEPDVWRQGDVSAITFTPEGGRNRALFWASCRMVENGLSHADVMGWLGPAAQYAGLPDREIETTVDSAFRIASRLGPGSRPGPTPASEGIHL